MSSVVYSPQSEPQKGSHKGRPEEPFDFKTDTMEIKKLSDKEFAGLQRSVMSSVIAKHLTIGNIVRNFQEMLSAMQPCVEAYARGFGGAYLATLVDTNVLPVLAHGVPSDKKQDGRSAADKRIGNTAEFMLATTVNDPSSPLFNEQVNRVNAKHVSAKVVERQPDRSVEVTPYYRDSFMYVVAKIVDHLRLTLKALKVPKNQYAGLEEKIFQFVYQIGLRIGLKNMPKDLDAHDRFVRQHLEKSIEKLQSMPHMQRRGVQAAWDVLPSMAARVGCSIVEFINRYVDREVTDNLGLLKDPKKLKSAQQESERLRSERFSPIARARNGVRWMMEKTIRGTPEHISALRSADQTLHELEEQRVQEATMTGGDILEARAQTDNERVVRAVLDYAEYDRSMIFKKKTFKAGETIIEQGDTPGKMFILVEASDPLEIYASSGDEQPQLVNTVNEPTPLGEIGLKKHRPAIATVKVPKPDPKTPDKPEPSASVLVITQEQFDILWKRSPNFARGIVHLIQTRILNTAEKLAKSKTTEHMTPIEQEKITANILCTALEDFLLRGNSASLQRDYHLDVVRPDDIRNMLDALERMVNRILSDYSKTNDETGASGLPDRLKALETRAHEMYPEETNGK